MGEVGHQGMQEPAAQPPALVVGVDVQLADLEGAGQPLLRRPPVQGRPDLVVPPLARGDDVPVAEPDELVAFGYGYLTAPGQWWHDQVRAALDRRTAKKWLPDSFEVCELHVHPDYQSQGLGRRLLHALLADLPQPTALLSTPDADTKAFRLYHADGFVDLARGYHFPGDARPFAILGARLPLHPRDRAPANS